MGTTMDSVGFYPYPQGEHDRMPPAVPYVMDGCVQVFRLLLRWHLRLNWRLLRRTKY